MNECTRFEALLEADIAGEIDAAEARGAARARRGLRVLPELLALHDELDAPRRRRRRSPPRPSSTR